MKRTIRIMGLAIVGAALGACGGGGDGTVASLAEPSTGIFVDSPVGGIDYKTPTQSGTTGPNGNFLYRPDETVTFSIGNIQFPPVPANATVTPLDIANTTDINHQVVSNALVLLQSLDEDGDPSNGITIPAGAARQANTAIDFNVSPSAFAANPAVTLLVANSGSVTKKLVDESTAQAHFQNTLNGTGGKAKVNVAPVANAGRPQNLLTGTTVTLDGSASSDANNDTLTYLWTLTSKPTSSQAVLSTPTSAKPSFVADVAGAYVASLVVKDGKLSSAAAKVTVTATVAATSSAKMNMAQTISDGAQSTTMAFSGLALMTGNLAAQSFFPPGKVADYTGFQFLRDNDPDNMGHNTSFLTRVANNVIYILNDSQLAKLSALAATQQIQIDQYGYQRYPLMQAFRRRIDGNIPTGSSGLNLNAVKKASRALYLIDGQISFDRAMLYASIINSLDATQKAYLDAMKGKGWNSWPDVTDAQINSKMSALAQGSKVAVMTYASDIFSWYAGSLEADVYFCPERHGTYYGGFYIKDAPAVGHEGYGIDEQMTATAGSALIDTSKGYVTQDQATTMYSLVATQKDNLNSIVSTRTQIATLLRSLITSPSSADAVKTQVLALSGTYGDLDGANNFYYVTTFAKVSQTLTADQKTKLAALRKSMMSGKYADGTAFDFSIATTPFLYSSVLSDSQIAPYIADAVTNSLFFEP